MLNLLYCIDENYNKQAYISIASILENTSQEINVYIIHKSPTSFQEYRKKLIHSENLNNFSLFEFDKNKSGFPNVHGSHVSDATYYRLFIDDYLPSEIEYILYVDADIVCKKDISIDLQNEIVKLKNSDFTISARTEVPKVKINEPHWERLNLQGQRYFNAGVMLINFKKWRENDLSKKLQHHLEKIKKVIKYWDQDVLNSFFDDKFVELNGYLNWNLFLTPSAKQSFLSDKDRDNMILIHYTGSFKPWTVRGILDKHSIYYQDKYFQFFGIKYQIINTWRIGAIIELLKGIITLKIFRIKYPFSLIYLTIASMKKPINSFND